jgi:hypothetical protein
MTTLERRLWSRHLAVIVIAVSSIVSVTLPSAPAKAQVFVGLGFGVPGVWGFYAPPPPSPYYYAYPAYYGYPYPYYYRYPYTYPAGVYFSRPFYGHVHPHWRRHRR